MTQTRGNRILFKLEDWRLKQHFKRVESILQSRDVSHLSSEQQKARGHYLTLLHAYAERGIFPRNYEKPNYSPCFIDPNGRECAVAHLVMSDGHVELVDNIVAVANYAYIPEMNFPELDDWATQAGLSKEELALIQPGYWYTLADILPTVLMICGIGIVAFALNAIQYVRKRQDIVLPILALIVTIPLLWVSANCLFGAALAAKVAIFADGYPGNKPLRDVPPFLIAGILSLGIGILTGGIGYDRLREFLRTRPTNRPKKHK